MSKVILTHDPINPAQIQAWKDEHKNVFSIEYPIDFTPADYTICSLKELTDNLKTRGLNSKMEEAIKQKCDSIKGGNINVVELEKEIKIDLLHMDDAANSVITGYFRRPTLEEIGVAAMNSDGNSFKSAIILYNTAFLGGHPDFQDNDEVKTSAIKEFKTITETRKAVVKKL